MGGVNISSLCPEKVGGGKLLYGTTVCTIYPITLVTAIWISHSHVDQRVRQETYYSPTNYYNGKTPSRHGNIGSL